jgi:xanthine dehydrogenase accessory factor
MLSRNELDAILTAADQAEQCGIAAALATVVTVQGSSYRKPGARMPIREDGVTAGGVSGGCLEADVIRKARLSLIQKRPSIHVYDTTDEDDASFGASLNCRGEITILIEPIVTDRARAHLAALRHAQRTESPAVIVLDISQSRDVATAAGIVSLDSFDALYSVELSSMVDEALAQQRAIRWTSGDGRELLFDYLAPAIEIILFGAGPEAVPLASLARTLGCAVTIVDERPGYVSRHTFDARVRLTTGSAEQLQAELKRHARCACVFATHNAAYERALRVALSSPCPYIGLLGPRDRLIGLLERLRGSGDLCAGDAERIYSPIGLDVGAETPERIALAIIAEIHAFFARRGGGFLRDRDQPLHETSAHLREESVNG